MKSLRCRANWLAAALVWLAGTEFGGANAPPQDEVQNRVTTPNFRQAEQYSSAYLRQFVYSTSVTPNWIDKTDEFWYSFKTADGTRYWRVNPEAATRLPLFDHVKLAAQLSMLSRQAVEPNQLTLSRLEVSGQNDTAKFTFEGMQYEFSLKTQELKKLGPAPTTGPNEGGRRGQQEQRQDQQQERQDQQQEQRQDQRQEQQDQQQDRQQDQRQQDDQRDNEQQRERSQQDRGSGPTDPANAPGPNDGHRNFSPDRKSFVFARGHNLFFVQVPESVPPAVEPNASEPATTEPPKTDVQQEQQQDKSDPVAEATESLLAALAPVNQVAKQESQTQESQTQESQTQESTKQETQTQDTSKQEQGTEGQSKEVEQTKQEDSQTGETQEQEKGKLEQGREEKTDEQIKGETLDDTKQQEQGQQEQKQDEKQNLQQQQNTVTEQTAQQAGIPAADPETKGPAVDPKWDELAVQLTLDGAEKYSFAGRSGGRRSAASNIKEDTLSRPNVTWSKDSKSFFVSRSDSRAVQDLWVINSLGSPRPTLETYSYAMPGESAVRKSELYTYQLGHKSLTLVKPRWKDEFVSDVRFTDASDSLRFLRRDRLLRNVEYCSLDLASGEIKSMFEEGFEKSTIAPKSIRFLNDNQEMIWWSERSGWGHFYLYDIHGQLKNPITTGTFFADRLVDLDEENRILYFTGMGREPGENLNYRHLYSVRLDGADLKLLDPGDANHSSTLSPSKKFLIDNFSRVDLAPCSILRNSDGAEVMKLEECDLSRLKQVGFQMPETFVVKAADGITDLFGNLYKPFDFDPTKKYPVITYVYPGPQQEGTRHTFTATAGEQQLAQIGFIVIQVGHRGGTPGRSKAYASFGYFNLRDYGLADKKAAIEQLAQRYPFVDVERVGIYGHSGGGFMTAAALMVPPYNDFFKAGFSTAGNHDNNIYNNAWSERWHGLREVPVEEKKAESDNRATNSRRTQSGPSDLRAVLEVQPEDFFYDYEMAAGEDPWSFEQRLWGDEEPLPLWLQEERQEQARQQEQNQQQRDGEQKQQQDKQEDQDTKTEQKTRFEIAVPTNAELAANLKHHLFLVHGELDNNVHPANTLRLVDALIKANKKFDMLYLPGTRHGFGAYQPYVTQRMFEFFADRLMLDYQKK